MKKKRFLMFLEKYKENLNFEGLSENQNPNVISLLEKNIDKIKWHYLSKNPNAIDLLKKNIDEIDW